MSFPRCARFSAVTIKGPWSSWVGYRPPCSNSLTQGERGPLSMSPAGLLEASRVSCRGSQALVVLEVGKPPPASPRGSCLPLRELKSLKSVLRDSGLCVAAHHPNVSTSTRE